MELRHRLQLTFTVLNRSSAAICQFLDSFHHKANLYLRSRNTDFHIYSHYPSNRKLIFVALPLNIACQVLAMSPWKMTVLALQSNTAPAIYQTSYNGYQTCMAITEILNIVSQSFEAVQ